MEVKTDFKEISHANDSFHHDRNMQNNANAQNNSHRAAQKYTENKTSQERLNTQIIEKKRRLKGRLNWE